MLILQLLGFIILFLFIFILYKLFNPYFKLKLVKLQFGNEVQTFFYPLIGIYQKSLIPNNKQHIPSMLSLKNQNPQKPIKFLATNLFDQVVYYVTDQTMVKELLNSKIQMYKKVQGMALLDITVYQGLLFQQGIIHKNQRKLMGQFFHFEAMQDRIVPISKFANQLVQTINIHNRKEDGAKLAIANPLRKVTGGVVSSIFFGEEFVNKTIDGEPITDAIFDMLTFSYKLASEDPYVIVRGMILGHQDTHRILNFLRIKEEKRLLEKIKKVREIVKKEIEKRIETYEQDKKSQQTKDFLSIHLDQYFKKDEDQNNQLQLSVENILQNYITFFFAGMDTTATYLTSSMYYISKYPDVQEKIRKEFLQHIPDINKITLEQTKGLKIFDAFAQEVLRVHPVAPEILHREALTDHKLGVLNIKKGDIINLNIYGNSNNSIYIENPEQFNINRWLDEKFVKNLQPFTYLPFSSGPRNCIGQHLAKIEFKLTMVFLLRNFKIVLEEDYQPNTEYLFLNTMKDDKIAKFIPL